VSLEVRSAYTKLVTAREAYDVAVSGRDLAKEALRLAQLRYDEGAGILLDVTTAQADLTRAQVAAVNARYQYLAAVAALQKAIGQDDLSVEVGK
jgi:outer membrane protein